MNEYTQHVKTVCVGRYLWDIPQQASVGPFSQKINNINIERLPEQTSSNEVFALQLQGYEMALRKELAAEEDSQIGEILPLGEAGKMFTYFVRDSNHNVTHIRAYLKVDKVILQLTSDTTDKYRDSEMASYRSLAAALKPRTENEVPDKPGLCIDGAFVAGIKFDDEKVGLSFSLPGYLGFSMGFSATPGHEPDDDQKLNARVTGSWQAMGIPNLLDIKRKTSISLMGQSGNELMTIGKEKNMRFLDAQAELWGDDSMEKQSLDFSMNNNTHSLGDRTAYPKILENDTAIAIWDAALQTVKHRPGAL